MDNTRKDEGANERPSTKKDPSQTPRSDADRVMNEPNSSPKTAASAGLGQTGQSGERSEGANPDEQRDGAEAPPRTPATQPRTRTVNTQPGEPYNDDTGHVTAQPRRH